MTDTFDLEWEGSFGYNDIIRQMANAQWHYRIKRRPINMHIYWCTDRLFYPPTKKYHFDDPETIMERFDKIHKMFVDHEMINVTHSYRKKLKNRNEGMYERERWVNRIDFQEKIWFSMKGDVILQPTDKQKVVVWHDCSNKTRVINFKNPIREARHWDNIIKRIDEQYDVELISYRDPVEETFRKISEASLCVGYHGIGNTIGMLFNKPQLILSQTESYTKKSSGPWIEWTDNYRDAMLMLKDINGMIKRQRYLIPAYVNQYNFFKNQDPQCLRSYLSIGPRSEPRKKK